MRVRIHPLEKPLANTGGSLRVPGDKSISHRALILAAIGEGESRIAGLSRGNDVRSTTRCLAQLGVPLLRGDGTPWVPNEPLGGPLSPAVDEVTTFVAPSRPDGARHLPKRDPDMGPDDAIVLGAGLKGLLKPSGHLDCGNSGTTMRLLAGLLAGAQIPAALIGDPSLSRRPMERVAKPLRELGADLTTGVKGRPPLVVRAGEKLHAGAVISEIASAQVKSAVLLAGLFLEGETSFTEPLKSRDHTERMLRMAGVSVKQSGTTVSLRGPATPERFALDVPGDLSAAAFLLAAALVSPEGSALELEHVGVNPTRAGFLDALSFFGAKVTMGSNDGKTPIAAPGIGMFGDAREPTARLSIASQKLRGAELDETTVLRAIDEVPILAVLGALASGETTIRGAAELRVKESDRLAQMATGLRAMGAEVRETPDGLVLAGLKDGQKLRGAEIDSASDHRIALAFSVAALVAEGPTTISGAEWADVSFPGFYELLGQLGARVELLP